MDLKSKKENILLHRVDQALKKYDLAPISSILNDKDKCVQYINLLLKAQYGLKEFTQKSIEAELDFRVKHVVFSFGLGVYLFDFLALGNRLAKKFTVGDETENRARLIMWMLVCFYHDYGYFIKNDFISCGTLDSAIDRLENDIFLHHHSFRYSKEAYSAYYRFRYDAHYALRDKQTNEQDEVGDHGILGGVVVYDKLRTEKDISLIDRCFHIAHAIMNHNLFIQDSKTAKREIEQYGLYDFADSAYIRVNHISSPLLFILSLVDTIENVKRYCRYQDSDNQEHKIYPTTLVNCFNIETDSAKIEIIIDSKRLNALISKDAEKKYTVDQWVNGIKALNDWVDVEVDYNDSPSTHIIRLAITV